ncbi:sulfatase-like hydrolase/transferase [Ferrimonas pelagia]|uniref:Sulfatase-like hydrolase/transferase n=1 Tax=Ferrimonas pelagia TaxID=1177826 RepID=A0ABP9EKT8_9GAMM
MKAKYSLLSLVMASSALASAPCPASAPQATQTQPNILFIFADDHVYESMGRLGSAVKTPHLDALAQSGTHYVRAYNQGAWAGAVCVASRTQLMTGRGLWDAFRYHEQAVEAQRDDGTDIQLPTSWPQRMSDLGYDTYITGKWHVKAYDFKTVFDERGLVRDRGMPNTKGDHNRPIQGQPDTWNPADPSLQGYWRGGTHWSVGTANDAIEYLEQRSDADQPFFAYIAFNAPHDPRQSPQEYLDMYPLEDIPLPPAYMESYPYTEELGIARIRGEGLAPTPRTEFAIKTHRKEYYALVSHLDTQIGRIMDSLEAQGLADNTIVIYSADHGLSLGNHSFMTKQSMYDHSLAAPLIIAGPGIEQGVTSQQRVYIQDVMPTALSIAGAKPEQLQDVIFSNLLPESPEAQAQLAQRPIYGGFRDNSRMVVEDGWKLMIYPQADKLRLFDLTADPHELDDRADEPKQQARIKAMVQTLLNEQKKMNDPMDLRPQLSQLGVL